MQNSETISIKGYLPPSYVEEIVRLYNVNHFTALLGMKIDGLAEGYCRIYLPAKEKTTNSYGGVHGGVLATLADTSMGIALRTVGLKPVTAEMTVNYLGQCRMGDELIAEGRIVHRGNTLILTEGVVKTGGDKIAVIAKGVFMSLGLLLNNEEE